MQAAITSGTLARHQRGGQRYSELPSPPEAPRSGFHSAPERKYHRAATSNPHSPYVDCPISAFRCPAHHSLVSDDQVVQGGFVLALLGLVLLVLWLLGFVAFHVSSGVIHILLVLAVISIIIHFLRGRTVA